MKLYTEYTSEDGKRLYVTLNGVILEDKQALANYLVDHTPEVLADAFAAHVSAHPERYISNRSGQLPSHPRAVIAQTTRLRKAAEHAFAWYLGQLEASDE
jgi:hypothetical protein